MHNEDEHLMNGISKLISPAQPICHPSYNTTTKEQSFLSVQVSLSVHFLTTIALITSVEYTFALQQYHSK